MGRFEYALAGSMAFLVLAVLAMIAADPARPGAPASAAPPAAPPPGPPPPPASAAVSIPEGTSVPGCEIAGECYVPERAVVRAGGTVTWSNDDSAAHTVTSGTLGGEIGAHFDSGLLPPGGEFSAEIGAAGEYPYFCIVHPWMTGHVGAS